MTDVQLSDRERDHAERAITLVDGDVHPTMMPAALQARLSSRWQRHLAEFGPRVAGAYAMFPRMRNGGFRVDARPARGLPGLRPRARPEQLLDEYDMDYAVLTPMQAQNFGSEAPELAAELCRALNDWMREEWLDRDAAPARLDLPAARAPRSRGARDRAARRRRPLRAGAAPGTRWSRGSASGATGRSCAPRPRPASRSRSTRAATRCTGARAGRRTTSRCTSGTATRWRCRCCR